MSAGEYDKIKQDAEEGRSVHNTNAFNQINKEYPVNKSVTERKNVVCGTNCFTEFKKKYQLTIQYGVSCIFYFILF